jgi:integral membrane sensor domain MASE1
MENKPEEPAWLVGASCGLMAFAALVLAISTNHIRWRTPRS